MLPFKKILCPTDFSDASFEALKRANELAAHFSSELYLVHVVSPESIPQAPTATAPFDVAQVHLDLEISSRKLLEETADKWISKDLNVHLVVMHGDAADQIVQAASDEKVDLIVIATHGTTGWRRFVFGSVAEKVVRSSTTPILTVPGSP